MGECRWRWLRAWRGKQEGGRARAELLKQQAPLPAQASVQEESARAPEVPQLDALVLAVGNEVATIALHGYGGVGGGVSVVASVPAPTLHPCPGARLAVQVGDALSVPHKHARASSTPAGVQQAPVPDLGARGGGGGGTSEVERGRVCAPRHGAWGALRTSTTHSTPAHAQQHPPRPLALMNESSEPVKMVVGAMGSA